MDEFLVDAKEKVQKRVAKPRKSKKEERLQQIMLDEFMAEHGDYPYPFSACDVRDPFFVGGN